MPYAPEGKYLWDSWFIDGPEGEHHAFHLQANRNLYSPDQRHDQASIGHAVSSDYQGWRDLGTALKPGESGAWDDLALWTGSVVKSELTGDWHQFYTGRGHKDPRKQRIGHAVSSDLVEWQKTTIERPLLDAFEPYNTDTSPSESFPAWRDPFVYYNEPRSVYGMLITARFGEKAFNGCIAQASSFNLKDWQLASLPMLAPGRYDEMEVPQLIDHGDDKYLLFSTWAKNYNPAWKDEIGDAWSGLHAYRQEGGRGEFKPVNDGTGVVMPDAGDAIYSVRLLDSSPQESGKYSAIGWLNNSPSGEFIGRLSDPFVIVIDKDHVGLESVI